MDCNLKKSWVLVHSLRFTFKEKLTLKWKYHHQIK